MSLLKIIDKEFVPYLEAQEIQEKITLLAAQLNKEYEGKSRFFFPY